MKQGNKNRLLIQVSLTEQDPPVFREQVMTSARDFLEAMPEQAAVLIIYQSEAKNLPPELAEPADGVKIKQTDCFSVSQARNQGLEFALDHGFAYILFHDASVRYSPSFLAMTERAMEENRNLCRGKVKWEASPPITSPNPGSPRPERLSPFQHPYLWAYLFKTETIAGIRFNPDIGPGRNSKLQAGEDTLFLARLWNTRPDLKVDFFPGATVEHPPRPRDLTKHLAYARAQGAVFRFLLEQKFQPRWYYLLYLALFVLAQTGRILKLRKNSLKTLREFFSGLREQHPELRTEKNLTD